MSSDSLLGRRFMSNVELQIGVLPPCAREVYDIVREEVLKVSEIVRQTQYTPRSVRAALKLLEENNLIGKIPDFHDMRSHYFTGKIDNKD